MCFSGSEMEVVAFSKRHARELVGYSDKLGKSFQSPSL